MEIIKKQIDNINLNINAIENLPPDMNAQYNKQYNNCSNTLCYTYSKNFIYKPHSAYGMVGRSSAGYLAQRRRL